MKYIDLHQDLRLSIERPELLAKEHLQNPQTSFSKIEQNNVSLILCTGFPMPDDGDIYQKRNFADLHSDAAWYKEHTEQNPDWLIVRNQEDIGSCINDGKHGIVFHIEGVNMFDGDQKDWKEMEVLYESGLRSIALTWSKTNALSGGNDEPVKGMTEVGYKLVDWALEKKLIVDLAHISRQGFFDFAKRYDMPLLVSHGAADTLCSDNRNYTDEQLQMIGKSGGCIGLFFSNRFLSKEECTLDTAVKHLQHFRNVAGIDAVALGTDFGGIVSGTPKGLSSLDNLEELLDALKNVGWTDEECEKVAYGNAARVLKSYLA